MIGWTAYAPVDAHRRPGRGAARAPPVRCRGARPLPRPARCLGRGWGGRRGPAGPAARRVVGRAGGCHGWSRRPRRPVREALAAAVRDLVDAGRGGAASRGWLAGDELPGRALPGPRLPAAAAGGARRRRRRGLCGRPVAAGRAALPALRRGTAAQRPRPGRRPAGQRCAGSSAAPGAGTRGASRPAPARLAARRRLAARSTPSSGTARWWDGTTVGRHDGRRRCPHLRIEACGTLPAVPDRHRSRPRPGGRAGGGRAGRPAARPLRRRPGTYKITPNLMGF